MFTFKSYLMVFAGAALILNVSCGSSSDDAGAAATSTIEGELGTAYPGGLAISVFPNEGDGSGLRLQDTDDGTKTLAEKQEESDALISGQAESCLPSIFQTERVGQTVTCYEFDQEMIYGKMTNSFLGTQDGTATGGEACLIAFARAQVTDVETMIDKALGLVQGMMCQAAKNGKGSALPAAGSELDYQSDLASALANVTGLTVTTATLGRLADQNSRPVFRSDITISMDGGTMEMHLVHSPASESDNTSYNGVLWSKTSVSSDGQQQGDFAGPSDQYVSVQYAKTTDTDGSENIQAELLRANLADDLSDIAFKNGVLDLNAGADFEVANNNQNYGQYKNPSTNQYYNNSNEAISGIMYIGFNLDPSNNTGTTSYWQNPGGNYSESARGMIFSMTEDTSGNLKGCGLSGAAYVQNNNGLSIRMAKQTGDSVTPNGFYHPFMNTSNNGPATNECPSPTYPSATDGTGTYHLKDCDGDNTFDAPVNNFANEAIWYEPDLTDGALATSWVTDQTGTLVSRQCVSQNSTGVYVIDTSIITENAGFEIIDSTASDFADYEVAAPDLSGLTDFEISE